MAKRITTKIGDIFCLKLSDMNLQLYEKSPSGQFKEIAIPGAGKNYHNFSILKNPKIRN